MAKKPKEKLLRTGERNRYKNPEEVFGAVVRRIHVELTREFGDVQVEEHGEQKYIMYPVPFDVSAITIPKFLWSRPEITNNDLHGVLFWSMFDKDLDFIHWDIFSFLFDRIVTNSPDRHAIRSAFRFSTESLEDFILRTVLGVVSIKMELLDLARRSGIEVVDNYTPLIN